MFFLCQNDWIEIKTLEKIDNKFYINETLVSGMTQIKFFCKECKNETSLKKLYHYDNENLCGSCRRKKTNIEKYGVENVSSLEEIKRKIGQKSSVNNKRQEVRQKYENTMMEKYGVKSNLLSDSVRTKKHSEETKKKISNSNLFKNKSNSDDVLDRRRKTNLERYGTEWSFQSEEIKSKIKKTNMDRYGEAAPTSFSGSIFKEKMKEKYGVENAFQSEELRKKAEETKIKLYGNINNLEKIKKTKMERYNSSSFNNKEKISSSLLKTTYKDFMIFNEFCVPLFSEEEYNGGLSVYLWRCSRCGEEFESVPRRFGFNRPRCSKCDFIKGQSNVENSLYNWLVSLNITLEKNSRKIVPPYELDVYIPSHNLAIEFNGLYWHGERQILKKNYHLLKTNMCEEKGIKLIHIFEDEWREKQEIVKSIILNNVNITTHRVHGRKTEVVFLNSSDLKDFYSKNHLQGSINSKINIALLFEGEIVSALSFSKPRFNKKYDWEITRFANKLNTSVFGGFAKMLNYFKKNHEGNIVTYSDKRYFDGEIYLKNDFQFQKYNSPGYYYTDYTNRFNRLDFQKHKLKSKLDSFNENLSEWENMKLNGYDRIWDCGNAIFILQSYH